MRKLYYLSKLGLAFARELVLSNLTVAKTVLSPSLTIRAGIIAYETDLETDVGIVSLANMITLTPGTLTLDVSEDRKTLYIHTLNIGDPADVVSAIKSSFENNLKELER